MLFGGASRAASRLRRHAADSESRMNFAPFRAEAATKAITVAAVELAWSGVDQLVKLLPSICCLAQTL